MGKEGTDAKWLYDVARVSGKSLYEGVNKKYNDLDAFIKANRSPDITINGVAPNAANGSEVNSEGFLRMNIGTEASGEIKNARPGDAFLLGAVDTLGNSVTGGLVINNNSNLRVKIKLVTKDGANQKIDNMLVAGWKLYIGEEEIKLSALDNTKYVIELGSIQASSVAQVKEVRLELPPTTNKDYQGLSISGTESFDLTQLFEIIATQENNPGWKENGDE